MNNTVLNNLQLYKSKYFSGLTDENMLSNALLTQPHQVSTVMSYIFGRYENNTLDYLTMGMGKTITIDSSMLNITPGEQNTSSKLKFNLRSSLGGQHTIHLPENAILQTVSINIMKYFLAVFHQTNWQKGLIPIAI